MTSLHMDQSLGSSAPPKVHEHNRLRMWKWLKSYTAFVYDRPWFPIGFATIATITMTLVLILHFGVQPGANTNYYRWSGDDITSRWDAYVGAGKTTYGSLLGMLGQTISMPKQFQMTQMGALIYERPNDNILAVESQQAIWRMENAMHEVSGWEHYCLRVPLDAMPQFLQDLVMEILNTQTVQAMLSELEPGTNCIAFKSITTEYRKYLRDYKNISKPEPEDLTAEILKEFILRDDYTTDRVNQTYFGTNFRIIDGVPTTDKMRSMFPFGFPIEGYRNKNDRQKEQIAKLGTWQQQMLEPTRQMQKEVPSNTRVYAGFPFALTYDIAQLILNQVWWLVGSFAFLFVFSIIVMRTVFVAIMGAIGVFFPIPCALCCLNGIFGIMHVDVIDVIALFLICGIGADCLFIIFELFRQSKAIYGRNNKKRLAYATQRGLIALATSISTAAVSFLALCTSGVRIMNFFGIFSFLLLFFTFCITFTYYLGILAIWAARWEPNRGRQGDVDLLSIQGATSGIYTDTSTTTTESSTQATPEYPHEAVLSFFRHKPVFSVDSAGMAIEQYNVYEQFFYNYVSPIIYFYRLPIVLVFLIWAVIFGLFAFQTGTKSELQFLPDDHPLQRAYTLSLNKFSTALNDFSYVYVWGIDPTPKVSFADRLTIDEYGTPTFSPLNMTDVNFQDHIRWTWDHINSQSFIDTNTTKNFGVSPWEIWSQVFALDSFGWSWLVDFFISELGLPPIPTSFPIQQREYDSWSFLWQLMLSELAYEEPDSYVPGTLKANTVGFSVDDYGLAYIGMKANMYIPDPITVESLRDLYAKAQKLERRIQDDALDRGVNVQGWMTGVAWLTMVTEEMLPKQVITDVAIACGAGAIVILVSTFSLLYAIYVVYSMVSTILLTMGCLYFSGWKIGTNEAIMISIASGFCADFIIQPMLALAHDYSARSLFGKIQASLTTFCTPVSSALVTTLVAAAFLYPCQLLIFPPFATFLLGSGLFGIIHGFVVLPALLALLSGIPCLSLDRDKQVWEDEKPARESLFGINGACEELAPGSAQLPVLTSA